MVKIKILSIFALSGLGMAAMAQAPSARVSTAYARLRAGDLDGAMQELEPLLASDDMAAPFKEDARTAAIRVLQARGEERFRQARIADSIADFDRQIGLAPDLAAGHWQRGIAYYYAEEYERGARQFELHRTVNPQDVENAVWHFLCVVRQKDGSVAAARKGLIPVTEDVRAPMAQIHKMFAGALTPEDVVRAGAAAGERARFYADLYAALYYEALGRREESLSLAVRAAENPAAQDSYMGDVARVHVKLRKKQPTSPDETTR